MRRRRLLVGGSTVAEAAPFGRPHLEEAEVLAVVGVHVEARFAARDAERLAAIRPEDVADRLPRRRLLQDLQAAGRLLASQLDAKPCGMPLVPRQARPMETELAAGCLAHAWIFEQPRMALEEPDHLLVLLHRPHVALERLRRRLRLRGSAGGDDHQGAQAHHQGFQTLTS